MMPEGGGSTRGRDLSRHSELLIILMPKYPQQNVSVWWILEEYMKRYLLSI